MKGRNGRVLVGLAVVLTTALITHAVAGMGEGLAMLAPALLLILPLLAGRYVGEQTIHRVRCARMAPRRPRRRAKVPLRRPVVALVPRGGLLLAASLATRPPPAIG